MIVSIPRQSRGLQDWGPLKGAKFPVFENREYRLASGHLITLSESLHPGEEVALPSARRSPLRRISGRASAGPHSVTANSGRAYRRKCQTSTAAWQSRGISHHIRARLPTHFHP